MKVTQNRLELMDTAEVVVDGETFRVKDTLSIKFRDFEMKRRAAEHTVVESEVRRPDLISYAEYGTVWYWWFIAAINGQVDPYEMPQSDQVKVPNLIDYYDWYRDQKETA